MLCLVGIGASGAVYGLMLFLTVDRVNAMQMNTDRRVSILIYLISLILVPIILTIIIPIILKLKVAHSAHFGGGLVGFLLGVGMLGFRLLHKNQSKICHMAFIFLCLYFIIFLTMFFMKSAPRVRWILFKI